MVVETFYTYVLVNRMLHSCFAQDLVDENVTYT